MFSPELSQHWVADRESLVHAGKPIERDEETLSPAQREALEALADRVNAARTIV